MNKKRREHNKKLSRNARKMKVMGVAPSRLKKDIGIPNSYPYKEELVRELTERAERDKEIVLAKRQAIKDQKDKELDDLAEQVTVTLKRHKEKKVVDPEAQRAIQAKIQSKKAYYKNLKELIEKSDVILEILDARDPAGSRQTQIEEGILEKEKKLIFVLNKVDLAPAAAVKEWQKHLKKEHTTLRFQTCKEDNKKYIETLLLTLKKIAKKEDKDIVVGVIGFPNVGKTSLIQALKSAKGAKTGKSKPIELEKNISLLSVEGTTQMNNKTQSLILRNVMKVEEIQDPISLVEILMAKINKVEVQKLYRLVDFKTTEEFLDLVGKKKVKIGKGNKSDLKGAATIVLKDWNSGKINFHRTVAEELEVEAEMNE